GTPAPAASVPAAPAASSAPRRGPRAKPGRRSDAARTAKRTGWTVIVWLLFAFFILGPLVTVFAFSLTPSIFQGVRPTTLHWYAQIWSSPQNWQPLLRSFEVATIVVAVQLVLGTLIAYSTVRRRIFGAQVMDA